MRVPLVPFLPLLALLACREGPPAEGPPAVVTDDVVGGSRLKAIWLEGPDGGRLPYGFRDTGRNEDCRFAVAGDGEWRCLPFFAASLDSATYFSDATCTAPVHRHDAGACLPSLLLRTDVGTCPARKHLHALGDEILASAALYARNWEGACVTATFPSAQIFGIGAEVDYAQFVRAVPTLTEERDGLAEEYLAGEDGSRKFTALRDVAGGRSCLPRVADDGTWRCLPSPAHWTADWLRADAGCVDAAVSSRRDSPACNSDRALLTNPPDAACVSRNRVFEVGVEIPSTWYAGTSGCTANRPDPGERFFRLGAEVPPTALVEAMVLPVTSQRIRNVELELPGWRYRDPVLRDPELGGVEVYIRRASDGVERWMPYAAISAALGSSYYADAACTEPLAMGFVFGDCLPSYVEDVVSDSCTEGRTSRILEIGEPYSGTTWRKSGSVCVEQLFSAFWVWYRIGAEVDPVLLAPVVRTLD